MATMETANGAHQEYVPFTPFQEGYAFEAEPSALGELTRFEAVPPVTPFVSEYAGVETSTPAAAELSELLSELFDTEFDAVLGEIAHEAWDAYTQRAGQFGETATEATADQFLHEWSEPVRVQASALLENIAQAASEHDLESMSEPELDQFFERFEPAETGLEPYFEDFLGGLWKKAKSLAGKAVDLAKKGLAAIPGISGLIKKLEALVMPLLNQVLRMAMDKLPASVRPLAAQLAQRMFGTPAPAPAPAPAPTPAPAAAAPATPDVSDVQQQFDLELAQLLLAGDETEQELIVTNAVQEAERSESAPIADLHDARARLAEDLEAGVDPEQALEQFLPAVMAAMPIARTIIGIIGRERVVSFIANFMAGFIRRYMPAEAAKQLSRAIADAGLRMVSLEAPSGDDTRVATEALVHTVEDTVARLADLDEATFEEPMLLEAALTEAFHRSAAQNFPPELILPELHEAPVRAMWVPLPRGRRRKYFKKYTQVFDVEITPQAADAITTFGGAKLAGFLKDQLGVVPPVRAKVHLYQAIHGTTLARLARLERHVPGLGGAGRTGPVQLHPLTVEAAGTLLHHPRLGRRTPGQYRSTRAQVAVGQRFYYLEIAGARPVVVAPAPGARPAVRRTSEVNVTLDFPKDEFRVFVFLSEPDAQDLAGRIRKQDITAALVAARRIYTAGVESALGGDFQRHAKILNETIVGEDFLGKRLKQLTDGLRGQLAKKVVDWVGKGLAGFLQARGAELVAAAENPADGVTIVVQIAHPPGAPLVRRLLRGEAPGLDVLADLGGLFKGEPQLSARVVPGFRFD
jgi:hypothetical protein